MNSTVLISWSEPGVSWVVTRQVIGPLTPVNDPELTTVPPKFSSRRLGHGRLVQTDRASVAPDVDEIDVIEEGGDLRLHPAPPVHGDRRLDPSAAVVHRRTRRTPTVPWGSPLDEGHREELTIFEVLRGWPDPQGAPPRLAGPWASASAHRRGLESVRMRIIAWHGSTPSDGAALRVWSLGASRYPGPTTTPFAMVRVMTSPSSSAPSFPGEISGRTPAVDASVRVQSNLNDWAKETRKILR